MYTLNADGGRQYTLKKASPEGEITKSAHPGRWPFFLLWILATRSFFPFRWISLFGISWFLFGLFVWIDG